MRADGRTPFQRAVARAYNSPIGLGGGAYHGGTQEGEAESAYLGVMRRAVLDEVGLLRRDDPPRRGLGAQPPHPPRRLPRVVRPRRSSVTYWPRESWTRLVRQFSATGRWRGELVRRYGRGNSLRFFAPPALVRRRSRSRIVVGVLQLTGVLSGWWAVAASVVYLPVLAYAVLVVVVALGPGGGHGWRDKLWTAAVLPTHAPAWGWGFVLGVAAAAPTTPSTPRASATATRRCREVGPAGAGSDGR